MLESKLIAELKCSADQLHKLLSELKKFDIIDYSPAKTKPQIILQQGRLKIEQLQLDNNYLQIQKEKHQLRTEAMINYVKNDAQCRSNYLLNYFGETENLLPCGKCDVCIELKRKNYSAEQLLKIYSSLRTAFDIRPFTIADAKKIFPQTSFSTVLYYLEWLKNEDRLTFKENYLYLK